MKTKIKNVKNALLSRFGKKKAEGQPAFDTEPVETQKQSQPAEDVQTSKTSRRHWLELPQDHSIFKLYALYREQTGLAAKPELVLEGPGESCLPEKEGEAELRRLLMTVTSTANKRLKLAQPQKSEGEEPALPDLDAQAMVFLAKDNLTAWILIYPPVGNGKPMDRAALKQALESQQVRYGVDESLLDTLAKEPERCFRLYPVARGVAPEHGRDGQVIEKFPRVRERKPMEGDYNQMDYTNLGLIYNVEKDGEICRIIPPTAGTPGRTVQDREVAAKDGKTPPVPKGQNTQVSEDGLSLIATMSGHVEFSGQGFHVKPVMDIPGNVDFSVGNISFLGDVCIRGDVRSGFTVRATGNITIDGVVEACTIQAGRDLVVVKGVQGDSQAILRADGSVFAKYLENCRVYARQDVETDCIINSDVYCDGTVTAQAGHGKIIGGKIHAAQMVSARIIGSRVGNRTDIILGGLPCDNFDYDLLVKEIQELEESIERTERQPSSPDKNKRLAKMRGQLTLARSNLAAAEAEREQQPKEDVSMSSSHSMKCSTVYPGTVLNIEDVIYRFEDMLSPCLARLVDGEIQLI